LEVAAPQSNVDPHQVGPSAPPEHHSLFREILSALNPLQYLPGIGTIYRAITGDQIPEVVRRIGSLIVSGLLGGVVGVGINLAMTAAEKISGIDLDQMGQKVLAGMGLAGHPAADPSAVLVAGAAAPATLAASPGHAPASAQAASPGQGTSTALASSTTSTPSTTATTPTTPGTSTAQAPWTLQVFPRAKGWSPVQLAAYGVSSDLDGTLKLANLSGADVLNSLELSRLQGAQTAYGRAAGLAN
jgi:hypothetical protein